MKLWGEKLVVGIRCKQVLVLSSALVSIYVNNLEMDFLLKNNVPVKFVELNLCHVVNFEGRDVAIAPAPPPPPHPPPPSRRGKK